MKHLPICCSAARNADKAYYHRNGVLASFFRFANTIWRIQYSIKGWCFPYSFAKKIVILPFFLWKNHNFLPKKF